MTVDVEPGFGKIHIDQVVCVSTGQQQPGRQQIVIGFGLTRLVAPANLQLVLEVIKCGALSGMNRSFTER